MHLTAAINGREAAGLIREKATTVSFYGKRSYVAICGCRWVVQRWLARLLMHHSGLKNVFMNFRFITYMRGEYLGDLVSATISPFTAPHRQLLSIGFRGIKSCIVFHSERFLHTL